MVDPLDYFDKVNFNTRNFETTNHVSFTSNTNEFTSFIIEYLPPPGVEKKIRFCRCWQSKKFPYCDDTHKVMNESGDSLGPFVATIKNNEPTSFHRHKLRNNLDNTIATDLGIKSKIGLKSVKLALALITLTTSYYGYKLSTNIVDNKLHNNGNLNLQYNNH